MLENGLFWILCGASCGRRFGSAWRCEAAFL